VFVSLFLVDLWSFRCFASFLSASGYLWSVPFPCFLALWFCSDVALVLLLLLWCFSGVILTALVLLWCFSMAVPMLL
jgi:hypothetical protein